MCLANLKKMLELVQQHLAGPFTLCLSSFLIYIHLHRSFQQKLHLPKKMTLLYTGWSGKIVFFHYPLQPIPCLHISCKMRFSKLSTQRECIILSIILAGQFVQPIAAKCACEGESWEKDENSWIKHNRWAKGYCMRPL